MSRKQLKPIIQKTNNLLLKTKTLKQKWEFFLKHIDVNIFKS